jgi:hemoglobin
MATPFEQVGGAAAVAALLDRFYEKMLTDPRTKDFFNGVNMDRLKGLQRQWWSIKLGATGVTYEGRSMYDSHHGMNISAELHDYINANILQTSARELGVPENFVAALGGIWDAEKAQNINH